MTVAALTIIEADPRGTDALALLRLAAAEARQLYPELYGQDDPWPTNEPTAPGGVYLVAYLETRPVAMGSHRPMDCRRTELRRMYVSQVARRQGVGLAILARLEQHAVGQGFEEMLLETGYKQEPAMRFYEACGYIRVEPFGRYVHDPTSVCYAGRLTACPW